MDKVLLLVATTVEVEAPRFQVQDLGKVDVGVILHLMARELVEHAAIDVQDQRRWRPCDQSLP